MRTDWINYSTLKQIRALPWGAHLSLDEQVASIAQALHILKDGRGAVFDTFASHYFKAGFPGIYPHRKSGYDMTNEFFSRERLAQHGIAVDEVSNLLAEKAVELGHSTLIYTGIAVPREKGMPDVRRTSTVYLTHPAARKLFLAGLTKRPKIEEGGLKFDYNPQL